eukprot:6099914-Amphidinium_carterae.2
MLCAPITGKTCPPTKALGLHWHSATPSLPAVWEETHFNMTATAPTVTVLTNVMSDRARDWHQDCEHQWRGAKSNRCRFPDLREQDL